MGLLSIVLLGVGGVGVGAGAGLGGVGVGVLLLFVVFVLVVVFVFVVFGGKTRREGWQMARSMPTRSMGVFSRQRRTLRNSRKLVDFEKLKKKKK